jgi:hypothetical protein
MTFDGCSCGSGRVSCSWRSSVTETENHLLLATDLGYAHPKASDALIDQIVAIRRMLFKLRKSLADRPTIPGG